MARNSPLVLLLLLTVAGIGSGFWLVQRSSDPNPTTAAKKTNEPVVAQTPTVSPPVPAAAAPTRTLHFGEAVPELPTLNANDSTLPTGTGEPDDLRKQVTLLEGQVEYLEGQVRALQDENAELIQKLGSLGMKGMPKMEKPGSDTEPPDFVGLGLEMMKTRQLQALPIPTTGASQEEVEQVILRWLKREQPGDSSQRFALALTALGWIPKPVDPLPLRASHLARQLGGWYDEQNETLLIIENPVAPGGVMEAPPDRPLALAFGQLLREFGDTLFPERTEPLSTDERLAREALIAGDAGLTRFLHSLQSNPGQGLNNLPAEDPDHPLNGVPMPIFLRELSLFPFSKGFEFVQSLHSAGEFRQVNAAYSRPPKSTAEIIDPERYLTTEPPLPITVTWDKLEVAGQTPFWDDTLGKYVCFTALRTYNSDEESGKGTRGLVADRFLAYPSDDKARDHAVWQTLWLSKEEASAFFKGMRHALMQRYEQDKPVQDQAEELEFQAGERYVRLLKNRDGQGVLLIDAASKEFAEALRTSLNPAK